MRRIVLFLILIVAPTIASAQLDNEPPVYLIKPNPEIAVLCETAEGREQVWQRIPELDRKDIGFQADGLNIPRDEYKKTVIVDRCTLANDGLLETYDYTTPLMGYEYWYCEASWNDKCLDKTDAKAPAGFQICKLSYRVSKDRGDNRFSALPDDFLPNTPNRTRRFRTLRMTIDARGKGSIFNQESANFRVNDLLVTMVPDSWPDSARRRNACIMPPAPPAPKPPTPSSGPSPKPVPATVTQGTADQGRSFRFSFTNPGTVPTRMGYEVYLTDDSGKERLWGQGAVVIEPGTTWSSDGYHSWSTSVHWRLRTFPLND